MRHIREGWPKHKVKKKRQRRAKLRKIPVRQTAGS